ncbi:MAG: hypothetical protein JOY62_06010 [Acidobacteriaceae bacterium]|nr:hypothetical protein [Acidobacteriaceae bacterium]MBV9779513.1 hypothetical protein [Acidobacteriaceae bacterium]
MAQITIYLPDDIENKARKAAQERQTSVSRWIADQISQNLRDTWPKSVLDAAGAVPEFLSLETIRRGYGRDVKRKSVE